MNINQDFLFAGLNLPTMSCEQALAELALVPETAWIWDAYRETKMLPLMTQTGEASASAVGELYLKSDFLWTSNAPKVIKDYFEQHIFNWLKPRPRIMILKTEAHCKNKEHIDCAPNVFHLRQHKLRYVIQGNSDTLYFITKQGNITIPNTNQPFLINGAWPHGMHNNGDLPKYTICVGAPWSGADHYPQLNLILPSAPYELPEHYENYFDPKYK